MSKKQCIQNRCDARALPEAEKCAHHISSKEVAALERAVYSTNDMSWRQLVASVLDDTPKSWADVYRCIEEGYPARVRNAPNWRSKVRQVVQKLSSTDWGAGDERLFNAVIFRTPEIEIHVVT